MSERTPTGSLRDKTFSSIWWSFIDWAGLRLIQFIVGILLARLLLPEQFGLIGMLTIFMAVAQSFLDSGFGSALIQKQETNQVDYCSIFYFNIFIGVLATGILYLAAPWIAVFYSEPMLTPLTRILSLNIIINSFGLIQTALLTKRLDFRTQAKISILTAILSGTISIVMAVRGFGVWSLVAQSISYTFFHTLFLWVFNSWRPSLLFRFAAIKNLFAFGSWMLAVGLMYQFFENIYLLVIGRVYSAKALGFYTRAKALEDLPTMSLYSVISRVTFPVFASVQDDTERLKRGLQKVLNSLMMVNFPAMIGLILVARPLIWILLTEKWMPCVPYLQLLCLVGFCYPLLAANANVLLAKGQSRLFFRLEILKRIAVVISLLITYRLSIEAIILGQVVVSLISYGLLSYYVGILINYPTKDQLHDALPYLIITMIMGIFVYAIQWIPFPNPCALLMVQTISGIAVYFGLCSIFRLSAFVEAVEVLRGSFYRN
jgi:teichuronic acid exporter